MIPAQTNSDQSVIEALARQQTARVRTWLLRSAGKLDLPRSFEDVRTDRPVHIHAPRAYGKSKFLFWHAEIETGFRCLIIGHTRSSTLALEAQWRRFYRGTPPIWTCANEAPDFLRGQDLRDFEIYCDEWWLFPDRVKDFLWQVTPPNCSFKTPILGIGTNPDMGDEVKILYP